MRQRLFTSYLFTQMWSELLCTVECVILCGRAKAVYHTQIKAPSVWRGVCKSFTVHRATSLNALLQSCYYQEGRFHVCQGKKIIALKVLRSSVKDVKKRSCRRGIIPYLPRGREGERDLCPSIQRSHIIEGVVVGERRAEVRTYPWGTPLSKI